VSLQGLQSLFHGASQLEELRAKSTSSPLVSILRLLSQPPPNSTTEECLLPRLRYLRVDIDPSLDEIELAAFMAPACRGENFEGFGTLGAEAEHRVLPAPVFGHSPEHWKTGKPSEFSFIPYLLQNCPKLRKIPSVSIAHSSMRKLAGLCPLLTHAAFVADESLRGTKQIERPPFEEPPPAAIDFEVSDGAEEPAAPAAKVEDDLAAKRKKTATLPELTEDQFQEIERLCSGNELLVTDNVGFSRLQHLSFRKYDWMAPISFANFVSLKTLSLYRVFLHPVIAWPPAMRDLLIADCQSLPEFASEWASCFFGCKFLSSIKIDSTKLGMSVGDLQTFFHRLPVSLDSLDTDFSICSEVSSLQIPTELTFSHPRLRRITLKGLPGMTTSKLEIKFCHLPRLCSVESEAAGVHRESSISKSAQNASMASPLMMRRFKVRNIAFGTHGSLPLEAIFLKMKNIAMMDLPGVSHDQILAISQLRQLRSLLMWQTTITDDSAEILCKSLPHLVGISITGAPGIKGTKWAKHDKMSFLFLAGIGPQLLGGKADSTVESSLKHMVFDPSNLPALRILYDKLCLLSPAALTQTSFHVGFCPTFLV
jgi:hypothetical protein